MPRLAPILFQYKYDDNTREFSLKVVTNDQKVRPLMSGVIADDEDYRWVILLLIRSYPGVNVETDLTKKV